MIVMRRLLLAILLLSAVVFAADSRFDIVILNGRITAIGNLSDASRKRTIDASGKVVAPGFIDMLGQSEATILVDPRLPSKIYQGITTEVTGEGGSPAPMTDAIAEADRRFYQH